MPYLFLGIAVLLGLYLLAWGLSGRNTRAGLQAVRWALIAAGVGVFLFMMISGNTRTGLFIAISTLPLLLRWRAMRNFMKGMRGPSPGQSSDVETRYLRMRLDHDSGELHGTVLEGQFKGRLLQEMPLGDIVALLQECRVYDSQSADILETYLDRVHGAEWRGQGAGGNGAASAGPMTVPEAYEILGLEVGAGPDDIREAHRRLMLRNHPDQGGSTYLAAKINQAKDLLLGQ